MTINELKDNGKFYRALLILAKKNKSISLTETKILIAIGQNLGFEKKFCEIAISELLENEYISEKPPRFSNPHTARSFIETGFYLALSDNNLSKEEKQWLLSVADRNEIKIDFLDSE